MLEQSADAIISVTVLNDDEVTPVDISTVAGLVAVAYLKSKKIVQKWSLNALTGFSDILVEDAAEGEITLLLTKENAAVLNGGDLFLEVVVDTPDVRFASGTRRTTIANILLDKTTETISKNLGAI